MFSVTTHTTLMGNRAHTLTTASHELANLVYEQAQEIDIEPEISNAKGVYVVEFIAADCDAFTAIETAKAGLLAGAPFHA